MLGLNKALVTLRSHVTKFGLGTRCPLTKGPAYFHVTFRVLLYNFYVLKMLEVEAASWQVCCAKNHLLAPMYLLIRSNFVLRRQFSLDSAVPEH